MDITLVYTIIGFGLAGYSVIANDSIQTLGTFIASKKKWFAWYILAGSASLVMIFALSWGWYNYDGDIFIFDKDYFKLDTSSSFHTEFIKKSIDDLDKKLQKECRNRNTLIEVFLILNTWNYKNAND